jgi:hypothetical protein
MHKPTAERIEMHEPDKQASANSNGIARSSADNVEPIPDEKLTAGGFVKVTAFMRTAASANAMRVRKARTKILCAGSKQVNVIAPELTHATLKLLAKEFQAGVSIGDALKAVRSGHRNDEASSPPKSDR